MLTENLVTGLSNNSIDNKVELQFTPNPTNDIVTSELKYGNQLIKLFDQTGNCVLEQNSASGKNQINLTNLNSGLYFIQISGDKNIFIGKVIKQ